MPYRQIDYLRISITDRCNLRCRYCMPAEGAEPIEHKEVLSFEEITRLVRIFARLGVKKIRFTGGEPFVRKGIIDLVKAVSRVKGIEEVALTTNGVMLRDYAKALKDAGLASLNISLDTLRPERFRAITRRDLFRDVVKGIDKAMEAGFDRLKLNTVVMKGVNDDEITDFIGFASYRGIIPRFIEFMEITPLWRKDLFLSVEDIRDICAERYDLEYAGRLSSGPAEYYTADGRHLAGFIKTDEANCARCSRLRLTSAGDLKICLYEGGGISLKERLRSGADDEEISAVIWHAIGRKQGAAYTNYQAQLVYMCSVGG